MSIDFEHYAKTGEKRAIAKSQGRSCYSDETVSTVLDEISKGAGVRETGRKYKIPPATISHWVNAHYRVDESLYDVKKREIMASLQRAKNGEDLEALAEELAKVLK